MIPKLNPRDASDVLKNGGTAIYPTEGIYGLGCDPFNSKSVENIFKAKGRGKNKSFIILFMIYLWSILLFNISISPFLRTRVILSSFIFVTLPYIPESVTTSSPIFKASM